jgi:hypothetical protein
VCVCAWPQCMERSDGRQLRTHGGSCCSSCRDTEASLQALAAPQRRAVHSTASTRGSCAAAKQQTRTESRRATRRPRVLLQYKQTRLAPPTSRPAWASVSVVKSTKKYNRKDDKQQLQHCAKCRKTFEKSGNKSRTPYHELIHQHDRMCAKRKHHTHVILLHASIEKQQQQ